MFLIPSKFPGEDIITGERLQALCDLTVTTEEIDRFHTSLPRTVTKFVFSASSSGDSRDRPGLVRGVRLRIEARRCVRRLTLARSVFLYTHLLPFFIEDIVPHLRRPFVLVSHNSDCHVTDRFEPLLENQNLQHWFAASAVISHAKLDCLPIGLANAQWPHGDLAALRREMARDRPKTRDAYVNFSTHTHPSRSAILDLLRARGFPITSPNLPYESYLGELAAHRYCISPIGNGIDAHRTWEALLLGVVPVVPSEIARTFPELPMLGVSAWSDVTPRFLDDAYARFENGKFDLRRLQLSWWRERIRSVSTALASV